MQDNDGLQTRTVSAEYVMAACGLLDRQCTPQERGLPALSEYRGLYTLAGRADGRDSLVGDSNLARKVQCSAYNYFLEPSFTPLPVTMWLQGRRWSLLAAVLLHARPWRLQLTPVRNTSQW